jgi:hypothetical protein
MTFKILKIAEQILFGDYLKLKAISVVIAPISKPERLNNINADTENNIITTSDVNS